MIAKALVFVCAAFGLVAGFDCSRQCSQVIAIPTQTESLSCGCLSDILASACSSGSSSGCSSGCSSGFSSGSSSGCSGFSEICSSGSSSGGSQAGNGPEACTLTLVQAAPVTLPAVEGPLVSLNSQPIPAPRILSQRCICTKTVVKPQLIQRLVTVPKIQRYVKRTYTPVVENVCYKSTPICQGNSCPSELYIPGSGSSSQSSGCECGSQNRMVACCDSCNRSC